MNSLAIVDKYTKSLFQIAQEKKCELEFLNELREIDGIIKNSEELRKLIELKGVNIKIKEEIFRKILTEEKISKEIINLINLLFENKKEEVICDLFMSYEERYSRAFNIKKVKVYTSRNLDKETMDLLEVKLKERFKANITLEVIIDASLIGGSIIECDGVQYKSDLSSRLKSLRKIMKG